MFKKILVGTLVVGLIGVLVVGAINRTNARTTTAEARGQGWGRSNSTTESTGGRGQGGGGWGRANATGEPLAATQMNESVTLQGTVMSVDENAMIVQTDTGEQVVVENRPWLYARESQFTAQRGDRVRLSGFYEGDRFEAAQIENLTTGQSVALRDPYGRPGRAGRGRRGG